MPLSIPVSINPFGLRILSPSIALPWFVLLLGGYAVWRFYMAPSGQLTPERKAVYALGMTLSDPDKLNFLADAFDSEGLSTQATALRNRANLPSLSANVQTQRAAIVKQALASTNPEAVLTVADAFEAQGAMQTANLLRQYAAGLQNSTSVSTVVVPQTAPVQQTPIVDTDEPTPPIEPSINVTQPSINILNLDPNTDPTSSNPPNPNPNPPIVSSSAEGS